MKHFCLLQSYAFCPQNTKKMNLQKFYIFIRGWKINLQKFYKILIVFYLSDTCKKVTSQLPIVNFHPAWQLLIPHSYLFTPYPFATNAPLILCHTLKMAPGMVAKGAEAKWRVANEQASPLFCMPTSMLMAARLA